MSIIRDLRIYPSYGRNSANVVWMLDPAVVNTASVYVFRSKDGASGWELLNHVPVIGQEEYLDTTFSIRVKAEIPHYRILVIEENGTEHASPTVGLFNRIRRHEYGVIAKILRLEWQQAQQDGLKILHYIPLTRGEPCPGFDEETNQELGGCPENCYGQRYVGGFGRPYLTWARFFQPTTIKRDERQGLGELENARTQARLLAFPRPQKDHLLVNFETDDRYAVTEKIQGGFFRGNIPVAFSVELELLNRNDPRYKVPLPAEIPALAAAPFESPINTTELFPQ
jgi:hypothetical protein